MARRTLLACGLLASLLYVGIDVLAAIRYPGYHSFRSQAVSELMARGAPTERLVDPPMLVYSALMMAFGVGVFLSSPPPRARAAGGLLLANAALGLTGPTLFEMNMRGRGGYAADVPHIVLTAVGMLLTLAAMAVASPMRGRRFRTYSRATIAVLVVFGALTGLATRGMAAGEPTPWVGLLERILIGALLLWMAVLAVALWRQPAGAAARAFTSAGHTGVHGSVAPGFEEVRAEFERNFAERGEIGAAVAAYWHGEKVVDLWGGRRSPEGDAPWSEDTMVVVNSTTKGLSAMTLAVANARGWLDYDVPVARYWPEFAQNGKGAVTVRQLLGHEAGLVVLDEKLTLEKLRDLDAVARVLARQKPAWPPGSRHGYHTMTVGLYMQELIRRVDPAHRTLGRFFAEEIARPLGLDFHIGLPADIPGERIARLQTLSPWRGLLALRYTPPAVTLKMIRPGSLLRRSFAGLAADPNDRRYLEAEVPAGNGVGTARAIARAYSAFANGGAEVGLTPETFARITAPPVVARARDEVLGLPSYFSLGFLRPGPEVSFGLSPRSFGAPGAGGSLAFGDPDARLGYAYVMNRLDYYLVDDPREKPLRDAIYRAIARAAVRPAA